MSPLPWIAAVFVLGVLSSSIAPSASVLAAVCGAVLAIGFGLRARAPSAGALALLMAAFGAGFLRGREAGVRTRSGGGPGVELLTGTVARGCWREGDRTRCEVLTSSGSRVALAVDGAGCDAAPGDDIRAVAEIRPIEPEVNGARLGAGGAALRAGIDRRARASACEHHRGALGVLALARRWGRALRIALEHGLARSMDRDDARRARVLLFGSSDELQADESDAFRRSGLAHVLAISGAHVALLAAILGGLTSALLRRVPWLAERGVVPAVAALLPLPGLCVFILATGEAPSALRALLASLLAALATIAGRRARGLPTVALSALLSAALAPRLVHDVGWQLSIVAAWALASRPPDADPGEHAPRRAPAWWLSTLGFWRDAIASSVRVGIAAAPVVAWHFRSTPGTALLANALAAPLAETLGLPGVLLTSASGLVASGPARLAGAVVGFGLRCLFDLPTLALRLPLAALEVPPPTAPQAVLATTALLAALRLRWTWRPVVLVAAALAVGLLERAHVRAARPTGVLRITALDVGQGDALLVDLPDGAAMLVDGGGAIDGGPDPGARIVVPVLADRRRRELAAVVASHPHPDHIGGLAAVLRWARVAELWDTRQGEGYVGAGTYSELRRAARERGVRVVGPEVLCGPARRFHGALVEVLAPCPVVPAGVAPNDGSFVLRLTYGRASALLPGDLERAGERRILSALRPVTLLKVGHHGSRTSSSEEFLAALDPRVALISAGHPSRFGHPHAEVLARLHARGVELWSTASSGAASVVLRADGTYRVVTGVAIDQPP